MSKKIKATISPGAGAGAPKAGAGAAPKVDPNGARD